jgi:uncharacterized Zn-binding protein involved in type VI secretion
MFTSAMNGTGGVQYHDASPNVTLYKQGSKAWRTSNRGLIKADLIAWQNGAIGSAEGVAVFADTGASERALRASVNDFISSGDPSVEDVLKAYVPGYVPAPPPDDEGGVRIEPHTALPAEDPAAGKADKLAATIAELIEYTPGIIEVLTLEELAAADTSGSNVLINGRTAVHADSGGTLNTVDICKTKKGKKCKPVVYNNVAKSGDTANAASTVFINGQPACHKSADFARSKGDEPAKCGGGVRSGTIKQKAEFITASNNVFIEGKPAVRQMDLMVSNNRNTPPMPLMQAGAGKPPEVDLIDSQGVDEGEMPDGSDWDVAGDDLYMTRGRFGRQEA